MVSLLCRFSNVLKVESKGWERYQKNVKMFMDARLMEGCRQTAVNMDEQVVAMLLEKYF